MKQIVIVGAGIMGLALARELLLKKKGKVLILEKEPGLGVHSSGRNSGVIHSGINQKEDSLKGQFCVQGSALLREYCLKNRIPMIQKGTLVVAQTDREVNVLERLFSWGNHLGVPGLQILNAEQILDKEPWAQGKAGLFSPTGAVLDPLELLKTLAQEIGKLNGEIHYGEIFKGMTLKEVLTSKKSYPYGHLINCAGLYADQVAHLSGVGKEYFIFPFRGEYYQIEKLPIRSMVYPVPDLRFPFLGVHFTRSVNGQVIAGPSAILSLGRESYDQQIHFKETLEMLTKCRFYLMGIRPSFLRLACRSMKMSWSPKSFLKEAQKIVRGEMTLNQLKPYRSGIRAQVVDRWGTLVHDWIVYFHDRSTHILNGISPGLTSSLSLAQHLLEKMHL